MERLVATFHKNMREQVRVMFRTYKGRDLLDLRVFWSKDGQEWHPSPKGLALSLEKLPVLLAALHRAADILGAAEPDAQDQLEGELLTPAEKDELAKRFEVAPERLDESVWENDVS